MNFPAEYTLVQGKYTVAQRDAFFDRISAYPDPASAADGDVPVVRDGKISWEPQSGGGGSSPGVTFSVTLTADGWTEGSQTVSDASFAASGYSYIVSPQSGSYAAYASAQIYADDVTDAGSITFHAITPPGVELTAKILKLETVGASRTYNMVAGGASSGGGGDIALESIAIVEPPLKTSYRPDERFDPAGMLVRATYSNGATLDVGGYTVSPQVMTLGTTYVTVTYTEGGVSRTARQEVTVTAFEATINVTSPIGSTLTCEGGGATQTKTSTGTDVFTVTAAGTYTITATDGENTASGSVEITTSGESKSVELAFVHIYSVSWDGSATTELTRGDDAALFPDPVAAVGTGSGSSPFDGLLPWSGMQKVQDGENVIVSIPKYWLKVSYFPFKVQIADKETEGFQVSPAHRDREDGVGERDVVYIGRYECDASYLSRSGQALGVNKSLAAFRNGIKGMGDGYYQADYAIKLTWWFLYLVEFANWNGQAKIGRGYVDGSTATIKTGGTDSMAYHTGRAEGVDGKSAVQYRWIENPWGNAWEWCDGIIFSGENICTYNNPEDFSDTYNGTGATLRSNKRPVAGANYIKAWGSDLSDPSFIYPSEIGGTDATYVCDGFEGSVSPAGLLAGGGRTSGSRGGPFCVWAYSPSYSWADVTSRIQKLPPRAA